MTKVLVDLHRTGGNKYNGLYHFCYHLGMSLVKAAPSSMHLHFYVPKSQFGLFGKNVKYVMQRGSHKYYLSGTHRFNVWHIATTLSWYRPFSRSTKNIYTIHDLNFMNEEEYNQSSKKKYLKLIKQRIDRADHLTFISKFSQTQASEYLDLKNKPQSIIYNGCNIPEKPFENIVPVYRPSKPFLFSIGQLHSRKNFHVLPALLIENDYELVIAGLNDFVYTKKVLNEANKHGVQKRVKLIGAVSEEEKYWYYKNCLAFLFPSIGEGFGLPVIEAMYFGKPVFLSTFGSLPEIGCEFGYYFENFDPEEMRKVFCKEIEAYSRNNPSEKIKQHAASFNWSKTAKEYLQLYGSF
jgi:glycosyltransferase involved in cell wall biosynthesis